MDRLAELDRFHPDPTLRAWLASTFEEIDSLQAQSKQDAAAIAARDLKIQALTLELAHLRRLRYGVKNEALSAVQRDLFDETVAGDLAAIEAEVERQTPVSARPPRARAGRRAPAAAAAPAAHRPPP